MPALQRASFYTLLTIVLAAAAGAAAQNQFPAKPVRLVTGGAGSQTDMMTRLVGQKLSERWGQPVVIENRTGAGGAMAASIVAKAAPDGYTLLLQSSQFAIGAAIHQNLPYDALRDFSGVTQIGYATVVLVVAPALGAKTAKDFIAIAQSKPGQILFSSAGAGSGTHLNGERFKFAAGIKAVHIGFKSSPEAVVEVLTSRVQYSMAPLGPALPFIKEGKLPALAIANPERLAILPDVPTMREVIPGYERDGSFGMMAPAGTPRPTLRKISDDVKQVFELAEIKDRLQGFGFIPSATTPEEFDRILRTDIETFTKVAKAVGLRK